MGAVLQLMMTARVVGWWSRRVRCGGGIGRDGRTGGRTWTGNRPETVDAVAIGPGGRARARRGLAACLGCGRLLLGPSAPGRRRHCYCK